MKKYALSFVVLLVTAVLMVSCNNNTPKDVASTWLNGFYHMDYDAAKKVSTDDTRSMIAQIQQLAGKVNDSVKKEMRTIKIEIKNVAVKGDTAKVMYRLSNQPGRELPLDLVKTGGRWLVVFTKSSRYLPPPEHEETPAAEVDTTGAATTPPDNTTAEDTTKN